MNSWVPVITAGLTLVTAIVTAIVAVLVKRDVQAIHLSINSRLTEMIGLVGSSQRAEGKLEGLAQQPVYVAVPVVPVPAVTPPATPTVAPAPSGDPIHSGDAVTVMKE